MSQHAGAADFGTALRTRLVLAISHLQMIPDFDLERLIGSLDRGDPREHDGANAVVEPLHLRFIELAAKRLGMDASTE